MLRPWGKSRTRLGRTTAAVLAGAACLLAGCSDAEPPGADAPAVTPSGTPPAVSQTPGPPADGELPRGGRRIFPEHQLVGFVGYPGSKALGPLHADLDKQAARLERLAPSYAAGRTPLPVLELIVTLVQSGPGRDGKYRSWLSDAEIQRYLDTARRHRMLLLLDVQPGRSDPLTEVRRLEKWLVHPDVGLAFDPEWAVGPGQVPGRVFGRTTGAELNRIAAYLSELVRRHDLPEKVFVFHQLAARIVRDEQQLKPHPGVVTIKSVDGIGSAANKIATWRKLTPRMARGVHAGFKLFFDEDTRHGPLMSPRQVLSLRPRPVFVVYE